MGRLAGKVAFITGAGRGIGRAIAERFAAEGASVVIAELDAERAQPALEAIAGKGGEATAVACDLSDIRQAEAAVAQTVSQFGGLDIVVNNAAATTPLATVLEMTPEDWDLSIGVNLTGAFYICRAAIPHLAAGGGGSIINVASQLGSVGSRRRAAYCASKAALIQLSRCLALDHADQGIRVNSLSPGAVHTERLHGYFGGREGAERELGPLHPIGRIGEPDEIASAALFLASEDSKFMTGADLVVDGGYTAQ